MVQIQLEMDNWLTGEFRIIQIVHWATVKRRRFLRNETNSSSAATAAAARASLYRSKPRAKNDGCERASEEMRAILIRCFPRL